MPGGNGASVAARYTPLRLHPHLFDPLRVDEWLHPRVRPWLLASQRGERDSTRAADAAAEAAPPLSAPRFPEWVRNETLDTFSFPLLSDEACRWLFEEVMHFQASGSEKCQRAHVDLFVIAQCHFPSITLMTAYSRTCRRVGSLHRRPIR